MFGSAIEDRITGASDIDLLVAVPDDLDEPRTYIELSKALEDRLGSTAYIIDLHVVHRSRVDEPPYRWWLGRSHEVL